MTKYLYKKYCSLNEEIRHSRLCFLALLPSFRDDYDTTLSLTWLAPFIVLLFLEFKTAVLNNNNNNNNINNNKNNNINHHHHHHNEQFFCQIIWIIILTAIGCQAT